MAGTCVAASLGRDAAEPRAVKPLVLQEPSALQSPCPTALVLPSQHVAPGQRPHLQTNPPAATSGGPQGLQARFSPACGAGAMPALSRLPTSSRSCLDKPIPPSPLSPGLRFPGTVGSTSPPSSSPLPPSHSSLRGAQQGPLLLQFTSQLISPCHCQTSTGEGPGPSPCCMAEQAMLGHAARLCHRTRVAEL